MTAATAHAPTDLLSAYLDGEVAAPEGRRIEEHLALCPSCRAELASLHRVVDSLRRLERAAPPPALAQHVQRRIALDAPRTNALVRFEEELARLGPRIAVLMPFAVILALATILYFFAHSLERIENRGPSIVVPSPEAARAYREPGTVEQREAAGRTFEREGDAWIELDLPPTPPRDVPLGTPEADALLTANPWLAELLEDADQVVFRIEDRALCLHESPPP